MDAQIQPWLPCGLPGGQSTRYQGLAVLRKPPDSGHDDIGIVQDHIDCIVIEEERKINDEPVVKCCSSDGISLAIALKVSTRKIGPSNWSSLVVGIVICFPKIHLSLH